MRFPCRTSAFVTRSTLPGGQPLSLLDTSGYGQEGANEDEFAAAAEAARDADLVLFVTTATNPGRRSDVDLLDRLLAWFAERPQMKRPPVVAAVNQIDLLSPEVGMEPAVRLATPARGQRKRTSAIASPR